MVEQWFSECCAGVGVRSEQDYAAVHRGGCGVLALPDLEPSSSVAQRLSS